MEEWFGLAIHGEDVQDAWGCGDLGVMIIHFASYFAEALSF